MDQFGKKAKCFRLKIDDSLNTCEDIKISGFLFISLDQHKQRMKNICITYENKYYECLGVDKYENIR